MMEDVIIRGWVGIHQAVRQGGWAREGGAAVPWRERPDAEKLVHVACVQAGADSGRDRQQMGLSS